MKKPILGGLWAGGGREPEAYVFRSFRLLPRERVLCRAGIAVPLEPKVFDTLVLLVARAGHTLSKRELMDALWPDTFVEEVNLAHKIATLRRVLGDGFIQTVPKYGYRFLQRVTEVRNDAPSGRPLRFIALPFASAGSDGVGVLATALPESIAAALVEGNAVIVRSSLLAARMARGNRDPRRIAAQAGVDLVLTGRVIRDGRCTRATVELIEAATATVAATFTCECANDRVLRVEDTLARRIVHALRPHLAPPR